MCRVGCDRAGRVVVSERVEELILPLGRVTRALAITRFVPQSQEEHVGRERRRDHGEDGHDHHHHPEDPLLRRTVERTDDTHAQRTARAAATALVPSHSYIAFGDATRCSRRRMRAVSSTGENGLST